LVSTLSRALFTKHDKPCPFQFRPTF
jgi:hypothetical protein